MSSTCSDSIFERGVISSSAERSPNCSDRSTRSAVAGVERAAALGGAHQRDEFLRRAGRPQLLGGLDAEPAQNPVGGAVGHLDRPGSAVGRTSTAAARPSARSPSGLATARFLGTSSPKIIDTDVAISSARASATPSTHALGQRRSRSSGGVQQRGDDGFGEVTGGQRGDRDAELRAGQLERQGAVRLLDEAVAPAAGLGVGVDGAALQRGQRELGGDEERRARREQRRRPAG